MKRLDDYRLSLERQGAMKVGAMIYSSEGVKIEKDAVLQLMNAASLPGVVKAFATPDIHVGYGVPIGAVVATKDIIVPAAVGYDINCGMRLMTTPLDARDVDVVALAQSIARDIPLGEGKHNLILSATDLKKILVSGVKAFGEITPDNQRFWRVREEAEERSDLGRIEDMGSMDGDPSGVSKRAIERGASQLGTLGGGNHFIEIQIVSEIRDESLAEKFGLFQGQVVVMLHSGSRGLGHQVGGEYMKSAHRMTAGAATHANISYLPVDSRDGRDYIKGMNAAANFAFANRQVMAAIVRHNFRQLYGAMPMPTIYDVPHNMAKLENHDIGRVWVHRKGATRAFPASRMKGSPYEGTGQPVLIPGSMGTASYLLVGSEEARESLYSVNHGAGRVMSRSAALGRSRHGRGKSVGAGISDYDFKRAMEGVYMITGNKGTIKEEAPQAYKDIDVVVDIIAKLGFAKIVARMRPLAVLKG